MSDSLKKWAIRSFTHFWRATWVIRSRSLSYLATWENRSRLLICPERPARFAHFAQKEWANLFIFLKSLKSCKKRTKLRFFPIFLGYRLLFVSERANAQFTQKNEQFAHLSWATWANRSHSLICYERPEQFAHIRSFVLSDLSEWANSQPCIHIIINWSGMLNVNSEIHKIRASLAVPDLQFLCTAVHVILSFSVAFSLYCLLFQFFSQAGWNAKKYIEKEKWDRGEYSKAAERQILICFWSRIIHKK